MKSTISTSLVALLLAAGCASKPQSQQLSDARTVVSRAADGRAAKYAPVDLVDAKKLLAKAEDAPDGSDEEVQYAYLADRAARRATSNGNSGYFSQQEQDAHSKYVSLQESGRIRAQQQLALIERRMQDKDANVEELTAQQKRLQAALSMSQQDLSASEQARKDADKRAAAAIASLNALGNVREEANTTVLTLSGSVLFETGKATLLPIAQDSLKRVAEAIEAQPEGSTVVIKGYTDSQGNDDSNQKLSQARAEAVLSFLASNGVARERLSAVGRGEAEPIASNATPEGRANNRRVELIIQNGDSSAAHASR